MYSRIIQFFHRYALQHQKLQKSGFELIDTDGHVMGQLEKISLVQGRIEIIGWVVGGKISLLQNGAQYVTNPQIVRKDVAQALGLDADRPIGFALNKPYDIGSCFLRISKEKSNFPTNTESYIYPLPLPTGCEQLRSTWLLIPRFLKDLLQATPTLIRGSLIYDSQLRRKLKQIFGFIASDQNRMLDPTLFVEATADTHPEKVLELATTEITIILPVYNAFELLDEVLERIRAHTDLPWRLVLIEDCSSDAAVRPFLRQWATDQAQTAAIPVISEKIILIENPTNLGFIGSVNKGLARAAGFGTHVVLLNSDTFLPTGWASRLIRPLLTEKDAASVTPMSNNAEIFSVPVSSASHNLAPGTADYIDKIAGTFNPQAALCEAPTGVGFCMAMHRRYLEKVPLLDTAFGRGYGEEVDWCQKARALGGRHLGLSALFVEHRGGASFGRSEKQALVQAHNKIISQLYPAYNHEVQAFIHQDPQITARLALALTWVASTGGELAQGALHKRIPIYLAHSMGGGAENYLQRRIAAGKEDGPSAIVLRVGGPQRWQLEVHSPLGVISGSCEDLALIHKLLAPITSRHIIYSNGVGDRTPIELPALLLSLKQHPEDQIEILVHDFLMLSPSYTLLDDRGHYRGVPNEGTKDKIHRSLGSDGSWLPLSDWRREWGMLMGQSDVIVCFSDNSRALILEVYPDIASHCVVRAHQPELNHIATSNIVAPVTAIKKTRASRKTSQIVGILGNIGYQKGAAVLQDMARYLADNPKANPAGLVVIGKVDPAYSLRKPAQIHGNYQIQHIPELIARYGITCWLIPSIWPETFSYTTHEALATGLPVWCFDLGAQSDTVTQAAKISGRGGVIPLTAENINPGAIFARLSKVASDVDPPRS